MRYVLAFLIVFLCVTSVGRADIIAWSCDDDGDGAIVMNDTTMALVYDDGLDEYTLSMDGVQNSGPAHVEGDFDSDTELDPTVWFAQAVENATAFDWTGYRIVLGMTKDFSFSSIVIAPVGWTAEVTQPTAGQVMPNGGTGWVGTIDYAIGTGDSVAIGEIGDFGFRVSFLGDVAFCTEQTPTPEPATMVLFAMGGAALLRRKR